MEISDELFLFTIGCLTFGAIIYPFANQAEFDKIIAQAKLWAIILILLALVSTTIYLAIKAIKSIVFTLSIKPKIKPYKITKHRKTKDVLPRSLEIAEPIKNPKIEGHHNNENFSRSQETLVQAERKSVNIDLDEDKKFYRFGKLNEDEIRYLRNRKFEVQSYLNPFSNKREKFIFKTNGNEGSIHFLLTNLIFEFLKNKVKKIEAFETVKPDIVFENKNKKIAIEVETGKIIQKDINRLKEKAKSLEKNYSDWFFVVTDKNFSSRYKKFGRTFDKRSLKNALLRYV